MARASGPGPSGAAAACARGGWRGWRGWHACASLCVAALWSAAGVPVGPPGVRCPAGSGLRAGANASSVRECLCLPGYENQTILGEDGERCEPCRAGFFKAELRNASCGRCPPGAWTLAEGSASAGACVCDAGHGGAALGAGATVVEAAPGGPFGAPAACAPCAPGSFKGAAGDGACAACPADHFCPEGATAPTACPEHSSAETGRAAAEECLCGAGFRAWRRPVDGGAGWDSEHACRACGCGEEC